jgi:nucleoside-triphosphatase THEP1
MELLSSTFKDFISKLSTSKQKGIILATVPLKTSDPLILRLKRESQLFHITKSNREDIFDEIFAAVINGNDSD